MGPLSARAQELPGPATALYYGAEPPWDELAAFDWVVLEPDHGHALRVHSARANHTQFLAYLSVGEVGPKKPYATRLPPAWLVGRNAEWGSRVIDQSQPDWPAWLVQEVARPLWDQGYRGFFLDTMDSFNLVAKTDAERAAQQAGLVRVVRALREAFPQAVLISNRGFEILDQVAPLLNMVAAESLYHRWNAAQQRFEAVPPADREWLLGQLQNARSRHQLPVLGIDYLPPKDRTTARDAAQRMLQAGVLPWVSDPSLSTLGVGAREVLPRKVLLLHDAPMQRDGELIFSPVHRYMTMPLEHLGLVPEYLQVDQQPVPQHPLVGRYAGIVMRLDNPPTQPALQALLARAVEEGVKVVAVGVAGLDEVPALRSLLGLGLPAADNPAVPRAPIQVVQAQAGIGFEAAPRPQLTQFRNLQAPAGSQVWLKLADARGSTMDAVAVTPWGGYITPGSEWVPVLGQSERLNWVVDPFSFLRQALALPDMPMPDTTTEVGRRLLLVHVDGDGMPSRTLFPGTPLAGEVMLTELLQRYRLPTTVSVIEGETAAHGLHPALSAAMEDTARRIYALPHVQAATHTWSHPFQWHRAEAGERGERVRMQLGDYRFDAKREIAGSMAYVDRLLPAGKRTSLVLWSGDTNPGPAMFDEVERAGALAMNGGDTLISQREPSVSLVSPLGLPKGRHFQVYAPNQNENVYTGLFQAPLWGYRRVIETFELTESPRRLKPVNIYFHTYAASTPASLRSLQEVYEWANAQPLHPLHAADYVRRVLDWRRLVVAREGQGYVVRGAHTLRQLQAPARLGDVDLERSANVGGQWRARAAASAKPNTLVSPRYVHLSGDEARLHFHPSERREQSPHLLHANARVLQPTRRSATAPWQWQLQGQVPIQFSLAHAPHCVVRADGRVLHAQPAATLVAVETRPGSAAVTASLAASGVVPHGGAAPVVREMPAPDLPPELGAHHYRWPQHAATITLGCG